MPRYHYETTRVRYHSPQWDVLTALGWITAEVIGTTAIMFREWSTR